MDFTKNIHSSDISIKNFIKGYYRTLTDNKEISLASLLSSYITVNPSLHRHLNDNIVDIDVLNYALNRLPPDIFQTKKIIVSTSRQSLSSAGLYLESGLKTGLWKKSIPRLRRRLSYFHPATATIACLITSPSDIDDLVNCCVAFILEWRKLAKLIRGKFNILTEQQNYRLLGLNQEQWQFFKQLLGTNWQDNFLYCLPDFDITFGVVDVDTHGFTQAVESWWQEISAESFIFGLENLPIYFVSSNTHSLVNIIGGYVRRRQGEIFNYIENNFPSLYHQWQSLNLSQNTVRLTDFLYFISGKYFQHNPHDLQLKAEYEHSLGIKNLFVTSELFCHTQLIPINSILKSTSLDPYITLKDTRALSQSEAIILNIDYPLGLTSYYLLNFLLPKLNNLKGIYLVGKAAILKGNIGDIQIPKVVFDERTGNIYHIDNSFNHEFSFPTFQSEIFTNQKAISAYSPFMENQHQLEGYIDSGFNIIEMESGSFLTAIAQHLHADVPLNSNLYRLNQLPFDFGVINYASDNPLSSNLGQGHLALRGIEPTYLALLSVLKRIIDLEVLNPSKTRPSF